MTDSTNLVPMRTAGPVAGPMPMPPAPARSKSMRPILLEYLHILQRRKWTIAAVLAAAVMAALVMTLLTRPTYTATTQVQTLRSPEYCDQLALLDYLCRSAPADMVIATKEHPAMIGAVPSAGMLALKRRYDRFAILPPATNNYAVLREAEVIVTVNSKSGAEAGLLGKRVIVLGDAFYREAPFASALDRLADLGSALERDESTPPASEATRAYFAALWQRTYPGELYVADETNVSIFAASLLAAIADHAWAPSQEPQRRMSA